MTTGLVNSYDARPLTDLKCMPAVYKHNQQQRSTALRQEETLPPVIDTCKINTCKMTMTKFTVEQQLLLLLQVKITITINTKCENDLCTKLHKT